MSFYAVMAVRVIKLRRAEAEVSYSLGSHW